MAASLEVDGWRAELDGLLARFGRLFVRAEPRGQAGRYLEGLLGPVERKNGWQLAEAIGAFPFRVTHLLTDRGSCFTADGFEKLCRELGVEHRKTRPYTPRTNGMVERFNGRVQREVLGVTVAGHRDLERLLEGFNQAYNARRQRVLDGRSPEEVVRERLAQDRGLANPGYRPPSDPCVLPRAMLVIERAKEVSQPDS